MKEFFNRLFSDTPTFFKRMQLFGGSLAGLGTAFISINGVPAELVLIGSKLIWIGSTIIAVAQFAIKSTSPTTIDTPPQGLAGGRPDDREPKK